MSESIDCSGDTVHRRPIYLMRAHLLSTRTGHSSPCICTHTLKITHCTVCVRCVLHQSNMTHMLPALCWPFFFFFCGQWLSVEYQLLWRGSGCGSSSNSFTGTRCLVSALLSLRVMVQLQERQCELPCLIVKWNIGLSIQPQASSI